MFLIFCPQTYERNRDLNVRVFCDYYGIPEDPATGSGNGCLAGYLVKHRYFGSDEIDFRIEQGYEIGRPSLLFLKAEQNQGRIDVSVGGKVIMVAKEGKANTYNKVEEYTNRFKARNDSVACRELLGFDLTTPEGMKEAKDKFLFSTICPRMVQDAVEILEEMMNE